MARVLRQAAEGISALELLMDETLCAGPVLVEKKLIIRAGGVNERLKAKRIYELLIRIAQEMPIFLNEEKAEQTDNYILLQEQSTEDTPKCGWKTDCYVAGRYSRMLQERGMLDAVILAIMDEAQEAGREEETVAFLEHMMKKDENYWRIAEGSCPILIYKGDDICHNVLNVFAEQFGNALEKFGKQIIYFDCSRNEPEKLTEYMHCHFQAVVGVQSYLFSIKMKDNEHYLHEYIHGQKYNFIFDHPVWMRRHLEHHYPDFYVLTHDQNYVRFIERYFKTDAILFPPAGIVSPKILSQQRKYDLTFVGTYGNYWSEVLLIHEMGRDRRFLANHFLLMMRKNPCLTAEAALERVLKQRQMIISDEDFLKLLYEFRRIIYCVMHYYRDRVMREILKSGIRLDVFGDSWEACPLNEFPNLVCHPNVTVEESIMVWQQSKLSLNIMSWHKGGFTERMANIMLSGAVLVTDATSYLEGKYTDQDLLEFGLEEMKKLPEKIKKLLENHQMRERMAEKGRRKTLQQHTWEKRAEQFLHILEERV